MDYPDEDDFERAREEDAADREPEDEDAAAMAHLPGTPGRRALAWLLTLVREEIEASEGGFDWPDLEDMGAERVAEWAWSKAFFDVVEHNPRRGFLLSDVERAAAMLLARPQYLDDLLAALDSSWERFVAYVPRNHIPHLFYDPGA